MRIVILVFVDSNVFDLSIRVPSPIVASSTYTKVHDLYFPRGLRFISRFLGLLNQWVAVPSQLV